MQQVFQYIHYGRHMAPYISGEVESWPTPLYRDANITSVFANLSVAAASNGSLSYGMRRFGSGTLVLPKRLRYQHHSISEHEMRLPHFSLCAVIRQQNGHVQYINDAVMVQV